MPTEQALRTRGLAGLLLASVSIAVVGCGSGDQEWIARVYNDTAQPVTLVDTCMLGCTPQEMAEPASVRRPVAAIAPGRSADVAACRNDAECNGTLVLARDGAVLGCLDMTSATTPRTPVVRVSTIRSTCRSPAAIVAAG